MARAALSARSAVPARSAPDSLDQLLDSVPTANLAVREEAQGESVVLWVPIRTRFWMRPPLSLLMPFRSEKGIALDRVGTEVWRACDGVRTVEQVVEGFAVRHRLRFHEARVSVLTYLRALVSRNLLVLVGASGAGAEAES